MQKANQQLLLDDVATPTINLVAPDAAAAADTLAGQAPTLDSTLDFSALAPRSRAPRGVSPIVISIEVFEALHQHVAARGGEVEVFHERHGVFR